MPHLLLIRFDTDRAASYQTLLQLRSANHWVIRYGFQLFGIDFNYKDAPIRSRLETSVGIGFGPRTWVLLCKWFTLDWNWFRIWIGGLVKTRGTTGRDAPNTLNWLRNVITDIRS